MKTTLTISALAILTSLSLTAQIPMAGQTCDPARAASVVSSANVDIKTQTTPFQISVNVRCDAAGQPQGNLSLNGLIVNGNGGVSMNATTFVRLTADSSALPTAILTGACALTSPKTGQSDDCRYWIMITQINGAASASAGPQQLGVVAFNISKTHGGKLAFNAGQVDPPSGNITVSSRSLKY